MKIKLNIDTQKFTSKPQPFPPSLRNRLCSAASIREVTPEQLIESVKQGLTFTPAAMTGTTGDTWQAQQVICADIDNDTGKKDADGHKIRLADPLTPEKAREVMAQHGIDPYFMYYSFSNADNWPKFRIVLILDAPITDPATANDLIARFTGIFNALYKGQKIEINGKKRPIKCADTTASDNARLYYGGKADCIIYQSGKTTSTELLQALPVYEDEDTTEHAEKPAEAVKTEWEYKRTPATRKGAYRPYNELQAQFEADKESFNLAAYVESTTNSRPVKSGRALYFNPCPICGHNNDFQVTGSVYHCHSASPDGGTGGSIIDYLINKDGLDMGAACDKFKYDIMKYDREEWRQAYIADKYQNTPAENGEKRQTGAQDVQNGQNVQAAPLEQAITAADASAYLSGGTFESDIAYFRQYKDRKTGIHDDIDEYLTLYPGLAALGGASSLGKTTFAVNLIDHLLDQGETVLYFSLEQLPIEIITKSLARRLYEKDPLTPLTNIDIKNGATYDKLEEIKKEYAQHAERYQIITGSFRTTAADIVQYVEKYRKEHGGESCKPIVIIDYLQLIAPPYGFKGGIREYTDENIKALKDMQKRNGLFVLMISNFNRSSNYEPVSYESFKETSMIEYTCDYVWGLQLALLDAENDDFYTVTGKQGGRSERPIDQKRKLVNEAQGAIPKRVEFVSLKNRNGKQFFKAFFAYDPRYDIYQPEQKDKSGFTRYYGNTPFDAPARKV